MRRIITIILFIIPSIIYSQEKKNNTNKEKNNELNFDIVQLIAVKQFHLTYERVLSKDAQVGISIMKNYDDRRKTPFLLNDYYLHTSITPHYRHFFSNKYAEGFFAETFLMLNDGIYYYRVGHSSVSTAYRGVALGIGIGFKLVNRQGMLLDLHYGIGRNIKGAIEPEIIERINLSFGYRF